MDVTIIARNNNSFLVEDKDGRKAWYPSTMVAQEENSIGTVPDRDPSHKNSFEFKHLEYVKKYAYTKTRINESQKEIDEKKKIATDEKSEFKSRIVVLSGELPLISVKDIPTGARSMMASIRDGIKGHVVAVARVHIPPVEQGGKPSEYLVYKPCDEAGNPTLTTESKINTLLSNGMPKIRRPSLTSPSPEPAPPPPGPGRKRLFNLHSDDTGPDENPIENQEKPVENSRTALRPS